MMRSANGGPAFPVPGLQHDEDFNGMSLRDYFAAKALTGMISGAMTDGSFSNTSPQELATAVFIIADAMLAERAK